MICRLQKRAATGMNDFLPAWPTSQLEHGPHSWFQFTDKVAFLLHHINTDTSGCIMGRAMTVRMWPRHGPKGERLLAVLATALIVITLYLHNPLKFSSLTYPSIHTEAPGQTSRVPKLPHIQKLCSKTQWTDGLTLWCHSACGNNRRSFCGGLTNARSRLQTCVRWAIDAGASELVVPHVVGRMSNNQVDAFGNLICADEWLDMSYLDEALNANCPRLKIRLCPADFEPGARVIEGGRGWNDLDVSGSYTGSFQGVVSAALKDEGIDVASIRPVEPVVFKYGDSYLGWNYSTSGELGTIQKELFKAVNYNTELLGMGDDILRNPKLHNGAFIGVHFRGEADWPSSWGSVEDQMRLYAEDMERIRKSEEGSDVSDVYVSCGDKQAIEKFREFLEPRGFNVHDKSSLLEQDSEMLARVEALDFDKKAVVDYQLLSNAKYFMGVSCNFTQSSTSSYLLWQLLISSFV